ncbi:GAF domain-containing protein [Kineococcus xinjiangensis]|nr:GAF domain-containing protein [Kineococcus xinjiangensis]
MQAGDVQEDVLPAVRNPERLAALQRTELLDAGADDTFDRFARLAASALDAPVSYVSMVGLDEQVMPGAALDEPAGGARALPMSQSLCKFAVATGEGLVIDDLQRDPLVRDEPRLQANGVRAYAGWPLTTRQGHVLGTLCVADRRPRHWTDDDVATLRDLSTLVLDEIEHRSTARDLARLRASTAALLERIEPARDSVDSLAALADRVDDPRMQRWSALARSRMEGVCRSAAELRSQLDDTPPGPAREPVDVRQVLERVVDSTRALAGVLVLFERDPQPLPVCCDALDLERAVSHLLVTALHHGDGGEGALSVAVRRGEGRTAVLEVRAPAARVPTGELGRVVARLDRAERGDEGEQRRSASIRMNAGSVVAASGGVRATASPAAGLHVTARWALAGD